MFTVREAEGSYEFRTELATNDWKTVGYLAPS
jgi:hypothetical protein